MVLLIDNYDSFTYNLSDYLIQIGLDVTVVKNDQISVDEIRELNPRAIIISPGPGTPNDSGVIMEAIKAFEPSLPILGICLGFQALGIYYGHKLVRAEKPVHGKTEMIKHDGLKEFENLENPMQVMRYHSLILEFTKNSLFSPVSLTMQGVPMAARHKNLPICGVQFHPEAWLTSQGLMFLANWKKHYLSDC